MIDCAAAPLRRVLFTALACTMLANCTRVGTNAPAGAGRHPWTQPGRLRMGFSDEPDSLNPLFAHSQASDETTNLLFAPLFRYDERGEFVPELATVVPSYANGGISRDGKTITLHFRSGVTWADGAPLDARDFRFTWKLVMNPATNVKLQAGWDRIAAIDLPDTHTAVVHLKDPYAGVLGIFGSAGGAAYPPLPEHLLAAEKNLEQAAFNTAPLSSGPWILARWNHGTSLEFKPNPRYWRGAPKLKALSWLVIPNAQTLLAQLQTHEIDLYEGVSEEQLAQLANVAGVTIKHHLTADFRHLEINTQSPALRDVRVRRAVAQAVDWARVNATVYHGVNELATSDILPTSWAAPKIPRFVYDAGAARALLDAAGWRAGSDGIRRKDGSPLRLVISGGTNNQANATAEVAIQQDLHDVGIALEIKNYPVNVLFDRGGPLYTGRYDLSWTIETHAPDPDNEGDWGGAFRPPHGSNTSLVDDPVINQTAHDATLTFDRARRKALYQREEERIHELVPAVFLYWKNATSAYNSDFTGYRPASYIANLWNSWEWDI